MKRTELKRKTHLKAKTPLKSNKQLQQKTALSQKTPIKCKQKTAKKLSTPYFSIFTKDMTRCFITGDDKNVDPHHIFGGARKALSEKYGFMLPLRRDWHEVANYSIHRDRQFDLKYKILCQEHYINVLNKTKEQWIEEFGKWWIQKKTA